LTDAVVLERLSTPRGELVLRSCGEHFEVISNGTFLMDTRSGESERLLVRAALERHEHPSTVLIGGLGVGFTLVEALADARIERVVVVEIEPALVGWHRDHLSRLSGAALADPRASVIVGDIADHLRTTSDGYDVICLDVDNGPDWTVTPSNRALYGDTGTAAITSRLNPRGVLSVWSADRSPAYEAVLHRRFASVEVREVAVQRGQPDVVFIGSTSNSPPRRCTT
jgi:spermidine synthase